MSCSKICMYFKIERHIAAVTGNLCLIGYCYIGPEGHQHRQKGGAEMCKINKNNFELF